MLCSAFLLPAWNNLALYRCVAKLPEVWDLPKKTGMQTGISASVNASDAHKPDTWVKLDRCTPQLAHTGIFHHLYF